MLGGVFWGLWGWRDWGKIIGREKSKDNGGEKGESGAEGSRGF